MRKFYTFGFFALMAWIGYGLVLSKTFPELQSRGLFGDSFGAFSALFTGLALAGTAYALYVQDKQSKDHDAQQTNLANLQSRTALSLERSATVELIKLLREWDRENAEGIATGLKTIQYLSRPINGTKNKTALDEACDGVRKSVLARQVIEVALSKVLAELSGLWQLDPSFAPAIKGVKQTTTAEDWEELIQAARTHI